MTALKAGTENTCRNWRFLSDELVMHVNGFILCLLIL